jgi:hypothetical protein
MNSSDVGSLKLHDLLDEVGASEAIVLAQCNSWMSEADFWNEV